MSNFEDYVETQKQHNVQLCEEKKYEQVCNIFKENEHITVKLLDESAKKIGITKADLTNRVYKMFKDLVTVESKVEDTKQISESKEELEELI